MNVFAIVALSKVTDFTYIEVMDLEPAKQSSERISDRGF
jgi:hypothetical protein